MITDLQAALQAQKCAAWLFYDHHHRDPIAYRVLGLPEDSMVTRRWYYLVPAVGEPVKLVHRIEAGVLDPLPGERRVYSRWSELRDQLRALVTPLGPSPRVAMQYSPGCSLPPISLADAGTVEQLRCFGCEVVGSGDLISRFDAVWSAAMLASHRAAGRVIDETITAAFQFVRAQLDAGVALHEYELQQWMMERMSRAGLAGGEPPIVAVNAHAGDPHYQPGATGSATILPGDLLLLDVWGRTHQPGSAYYDVTWMGYCLRPGESTPPTHFEQAFSLVRDARDAGIARILAATAAGRPLHGFEVDQAVRAVIEAAGLGEFFVHRTGHSLGREVHATGANMDDFETHDDRLLLPFTALTIEPGLYCPNGQPFGVRSEVNMFVGEHGAEVTSPRQQQIVRI